MVLAHNLTAMNAQRQFNIVGTSKKKSTEKLSSGYKINRAADDAAGLTISEKMRSQIRGLHQGAETVQAGISYVQVAEGALAEVTDMMHRLTELSVQSANGTNTVEDREAIDKEVQQLKTEMQRVFISTEFNTIPIWDEPMMLSTKEIREPVPSTFEQVASFAQKDNRFNLTNESYDKVALFLNGYKVKADDDGVSIVWDDYNGDSHKTKTISWEGLKQKNFKFEVSDYLEDDLRDSSGKALINFSFDLNVNSAATIDDVKKYINGKEYYVSNGLTTATRGVDIYTLPYLSNAAFASAKYGTTSDKFDFSKPNNSLFIKPIVNNGTNLTCISGNNTTSVDIAEKAVEPWKLKFYVEGLGEVEAECTQVAYNDIKKWKALEDINGNTTGSLSSALSIIDLNYTYEDRAMLDFGFLARGTTSIKSVDETGMTNEWFGLSISVKLDVGETKDSLLNKINNLLNDSSIIDVETVSPAVSYVHSPGNEEQLIEVSHPDKITTITEYVKASKDLWIQAGPNINNGLNITYDSLRLETIGLANMKVDTEDNALKSIDEVSNALSIITEQRSLFGAYQNRLEHTYSNDKNIEENTTAAESRIRDTDMATEMVNNTKLSVLEQAVTSMMAQANQSTQGVLSLLQ